MGSSPASKVKAVKPWLSALLGWQCALSSPGRRIARHMLPSAFFVNCLIRLLSLKLSWACVRLAVHLNGLAAAHAAGVLVMVVMPS